MEEQTDKLNRIRSAFHEIDAETITEQRGQFNDVLIIDNRYVFRFPRSDAAAKTLSREVALLKVIQRRVSLQVPVPLNIEDESPQDFMGYEMLPGEPLGYSDVTDANRPVLARQLAGFLHELHDVPLHELPAEIETGELPVAWARFYRDVCDHLFPHMREEARHRVARQFEAYFEAPHRYSFDTCLRHGDFGLGNILWDPKEERITGIIDFDSCAPGDPAQDLGSLLVCFGSSFVEEMYRSYPELEDMYDRAVFYTGTYALQQALAALKDGDEAMFEDGIARFR